MLFYPGHLSFTKGKTRDKSNLARREILIGAALWWIITFISRPVQVLAGGGGSTPKSPLPTWVQGLNIQQCFSGPHECTCKM